MGVAAILESKDAAELAPGRASRSRQRAREGMRPAVRSDDSATRGAHWPWARTRARKRRGSSKRRARSRASSRDKLDLDASVRLWDGSRAARQERHRARSRSTIADAGVIGSLLRRPTLDNIIHHYVDKGIDFSGGTLIDFGRAAQPRRALGEAQGPRRRCSLAREAGAVPRSRSPRPTPATIRASRARSPAGKRKIADNKDFIQFHYDLSNDFYALFLDPEMVYSCAYFTDWDNDIAQAQRDKLEMICRKLRLKPGERILDIGCGWGGLVCHAAKNYGVTAHGITLSEEQLAFAREKVKRLGLEDHVTFELNDYSTIDGHVRQDRLDRHVRAYRPRRTSRPTCAKMPHAAGRRRPVPQPRHLARARRKQRAGSSAACGPSRRRSPSTSSPAASSTTSATRSSPWSAPASRCTTSKAGALHYARTCKLWCERLTANREEAADARRRGEVPHLGCLSGRRLRWRFSRGTLRIFQTLASKSAKRPSAIPPTRADLYR